MINKILSDRPTKLFVAFSSFLVANALIAEAIGTNLFSLEGLLGLKPANFTLFGQSGLAFTLTCGVLLWPLEFVITDIINEFYGPRAVRRISITAVALIAYAFLMYFNAIGLPPQKCGLIAQSETGGREYTNIFQCDIRAKYAHHYWKHRCVSSEPGCGRYCIS